MKKLIPQRIKNYYHLAQAVLANLWFCFPSRKLKVIGVTGTNGKTTTVQMITKILEESGENVAMASTINFKLGEKTWVNATKFTTLSSWQVQKFIKLAVEASCQYLVLETSSHSLDQNRVWGIKFDTAVITNVTREHLDYHGDMETYRIAKLKLFQNARVAVVNLDMESPEEYIDCRARNRYLYLCHSERSEESNNLIRSLGKLGMTSIVKAENIEFGINYTKYQILDTKYKLNLLGKFNLENALAATCVGLAYEIDLKTIAAALSKIKGVPGRMEKIENNLGLNIIIDYAVTPDSLEKLYFLIDAMRKSKNHPEQSEACLPARQGSRDSSDLPQNDKKIIAVFGACGDRDRGKRPIMGEIVSKYADYIIITNEDPYYEDPVQIIDEVAAGVKNKKESDNFWRIMDRRVAIKKALELARAGDFVIVTGKGAEEMMSVGKKMIPWNDQKVIQEVLREVAL
jgi:UDP-N-acetylmuramoyl-L-alanyl-D-glutamate--2,6-diaminopimelate ligase